MRTTTAYAFHPETGAYVGETVADECQREEGVFYPPRFATLIPPPALQSGERARFSEGEWIVEDIPAPEPEPEVPLEELKEQHWTQIKVNRDAAERGGFDVPSIGRFDSDLSSQQKIIGAVVAARYAQENSLRYSIDWTLEDNSVVTLDADKMIQVGLALMAHVDVVHQQGRERRGSISAARSALELIAIDWD